MDFKLIHKKIHASLTPKEEKRFQDWYDSSPDHRAYFERFRKQQQADAFVKPDTAKAWKKMEQEISPASRIPYQWIAVAAAIVVSVLLVPRLFHNQKEPSDSQVVETQNTETDVNAIVFTDDQGKSQLLGQQDSLLGAYFYASKEGLQINSEALDSGAGESRMNSLTVPRTIQYTLELSDGTKVWLNSDTKIRFPSSFDNSDSRTVYLDYGEAYFEVTSSVLASGRNFIVETDSQRIEVLGTQFNINAYWEEEAVATTLVEGAVAVRGGGSSTKLKPGQQSVLNKLGGELHVQQVDPSKVISWREGIYVFEDKSLAEIMRVLERWYDVEVSFEGELAKKELFNGVLRNDQELDVIVQILESTNKAAFEIKGDSIKIWDK